MKVYDLEELFHFAKQLVKKILKCEDILHIWLFQQSQVTKP